MNKSWKIYKLIDPLIDKVRYIELYKDDNEHTSKKNEWIKGLKLLNLSPKIEMIEEIFNYEEAKTREKYWIDYYKSEWLLNTDNNSSYIIDKGYHLASVKINPILYQQFQINSIYENTTFQEFVNTSMYAYNNDKKFREIIKNKIINLIAEINSFNLSGSNYEFANSL